VRRRCDPVGSAVHADSRVHRQQVRPEAIHVIGLKSRWPKKG
jgi:hypothetical protein